MGLLISFVLAASPLSLAADATLSQQKIQIIKGNDKKGAKVLAPVTSEPRPADAACAQCAPARADTQQAEALRREAAALDERTRALAEREQAVEARESAHAEAEAKKAERLRAQQKQIERLGAQNQRAWQNVNNALIGAE
jgi:hypothetical protein